VPLARQNPEAGSILNDNFTSKLIILGVASSRYVPKKSRNLFSLRAQNQEKKALKKCGIYLVVNANEGRIGLSN